MKVYKKSIGDVLKPQNQVSILQFRRFRTVCGYLHQVFAGQRACVFLEASQCSFFRPEANEEESVLHTLHLAIFRNATESLHSVAVNQIGKVDVACLLYGLGKITAVGAQHLSQTDNGLGFSTRSPLQANDLAE